MQPRCLQLDAADNVAVALVDMGPGAYELLGPCSYDGLAAIEAIGRGHKVALRPIENGESVVKYGVAIGDATTAIAAGAWVHTHNCRSRFDERSHTLDRHTGAPTDTEYA